MVDEKNSDSGWESQFPVGLRVLIVDDDPVCLSILRNMLSKCEYHVTACRLASMALSMLRENKGSFDIVISDVHMPDIDGFNLLKQVGMEMNLPVIMMSGDEDTSVVMKGIKHGACDYLIKPVRIHELKNIWQHVIRKKRGFEDVVKRRKKYEGSNYIVSVIRKWKEPGQEHDDGKQECDKSSSQKKNRVIWTGNLHRQFLRAVNHLGLDNAFPKKILDLMNVEGLTREHVASHLQKYKFSLKRSAGQRYSVFGMSSSFGATRATNYISIDTHGNFNVPAPLTSSQMAPQSMVLLQAELPKGSYKYNQWRSTEDSFHEQATVRTEKCNPLNKENLGQSSMTDEANIVPMWPNEIGMKFPQIQKEMPCFSDVGKSTNQICSRFPTTQDKITKGDFESESLGQICLSNIAESQSQPKDVFIMHLSQRQQLPATQYLHSCIELPSPRLGGSHVQNLSYDNYVGTDVLLTDIGGSVPNDSVGGNNVIDESSPLQMNYMSSVACNLTPSTSVSFIENEIRSKVDYENYDLPISSVNNFSASGALGSSLPLSSIVRDFAAQVQGLKSVGGNNEMRTSETLSNICMSSGILEKINQHNRVGCEIQNTSKNPDLSHNVYPAHLQGYSKACPGFSTEALNLPRTQAYEAVPQRTVSGVQSQRDHTLYDNGVGFQCEDTPDVIEYLREGRALFEFSPSYDIMDPLFQ